MKIGTIYKWQQVVTDEKGRTHLLNPAANDSAGTYAANFVFESVEQAVHFKRKYASQMDWQLVETNTKIINIDDLEKSEKNY